MVHLTVLLIFACFPSAPIDIVRIILTEQRPAISASKLPLPRPIDLDSVQSASGNLAPIAGFDSIPHYVNYRFNLDLSEADILSGILVTMPKAFSKSYRWMHWCFWSTFKSEVGFRKILVTLPTIALRTGNDDVVPSVAATS